MVWAAGEQDIVFYVDNGCIVGINPIRVHGTLTMLVRMFERVGLYKNLGNIISITSMTGFIWGHMGKDAYKRGVAG